MKKSFKKPRLLLLLLTCCFLFGCSATIPIPVSRGTLQSTTDTSLVKIFFNPRTEPNFVKSLYTVYFKQDEQESLRFRYAISYKNPDKLRIETLPINAFYTLSLFTTSEGKFSLKDLQNNHQETGELSEEVLKKAFGISISIPEILSIIQMKVPYSISEVHIYNSDNGISVFSNDNKFVGEFSKELNPSRYFLIADNKVKALINFNYEKNGSKPKIEIYTPQYDISAYFELRSVDWSHAPSDSLFLPTP